MLVVMIWKETKYLWRMRTTMRRVKQPQGLTKLGVQGNQGPGKIRAIDDVTIWVTDAPTTSRKYQVVLRPLSL